MEGRMKASADPTLDELMPQATRMKEMTKALKEFSDINFSSKNLI